jgi:hypothetical protein
VADATAPIEPVAAAPDAPRPHVAPVDPPSPQQQPPAPKSPARTAAATANAAPEGERETPRPRRGQLAQGDLAPDFTLASADGATSYTLSSLRGKPVVLVFGSCTCPPFVRSTRATGALFERYRTRANFLMVYVREAHPTDGWAVEGNRFKVAQPTTLEQRRKIAQDFVKEIGIRMPLAVDTIEGAAERLYDPFPNRLVVIDAAGRIAHIGARGPQSTLNSAREVPAVLDGLLGPR